MKKLITTIFSCLIMALIQPAMGQTVIAEESFDSNELGWTEDTKPDLGECVIMDGQFKFDSKITSKFYDAKSNRPTLLLSETDMPLDPAHGFEISTDIIFDHVGSMLGISLDNLNYTSGFLLEYDDDYNFIAIAVNESNCYILFYKNGELTRYKVAAVKMKGINKNKVTTNLKIVYRNYKIKVLVDNIEMVEIKKVNIESPTIALFTTGKRKVVFDNLIVSQ